LTKFDHSIATPTDLQRVKIVPTTLPPPPKGLRAPIQSNAENCTGVGKVYPQDLLSVRFYPTSLLDLMIPELKRRNLKYVR